MTKQIDKKGLAGKGGVITNGDRIDNIIRWTFLSYPMTSGTLSVVYNKDRLYSPWDECIIYVENSYFVFEGNIIITAISDEGDELVLSYQATSQNKRSG